jgi:glycosyltransferase involved in cell wall biosynthesis
VQPLEGLVRELRVFQPDVVVATGSDPTFTTEVLDRCAAYPTILYVRDAAAVPVTGADVHFDVSIANSRALANAMERPHARTTFLPSLFPPRLYKVATTRQKVLFVNPIPKKGVDVVLRLAEVRPDIPFVFNLSWQMKSSRLRDLRRSAKRLGNIEIRTPTTDPQALFRDCRLVLVPTQWPEAWCRVVSEAQISGIPAVASAVGGLPESVGPGGLLVEQPDSEQAWLDALSSMWDDQELYRQLSESALAHSRRPELSVTTVLEHFEDLLRRATESHARCVP